MTISLIYFSALGLVVVETITGAGCFSMDETMVCMENSIVHKFRHAFICSVHF